MFQGKCTHIKLRIIILVLSLMAFFSSGSGGYLYYSSVKNAAFEEAKRQAIFHAETIRNHLSSFLFENLNSVKALSGMKELSNALLVRDETSLSKANLILDHFKNAFQVDVCYLIDRHGNTVASSNRHEPDSFIGQNYAFRPYFQQAVKEGSKVFSSYMALGITSEKRGIYYSYPVFSDNQEKPLGVAVIKAPIDPMEKEFVKAYDGIVMLTDPHGIVFLSSHVDFVLQTLSKLSSEETAQVQEYKQFGNGPWKWTGLNMTDENHATDTSGNQYLFHKLPVDNYPGWNLVYLSNMDAILKRVSVPLIRISSYLVLTWCLFVGLAVFILFRKANREINQRKKAEEALKDAHDELEKRVDERTVDLAKTVNELRNEMAERQRMESALRASEKEYRTLTDNLSVGVFRVTPGPKGDIIKVNPAFMRLFGFRDKNMLLSSHVYELYQNPDDRERFSQKINRTGAVRNEEIMLKKKDGTPFLGSVTAVIVKNTHNETKYFDGIIEDITDHKKAEEEIRKRREEIAHLRRVATMGELAASLAHELNQPLAAILTNAQTAIRFMEEESPDLQEIHNILKDIVADNRRASEVIRGLRSLFRKGELEKTRVDINSLVQDVISLINSEVVIRGISIKPMLDNRLPHVSGDRVHLQQVLINFILNASEAMSGNNDNDREIVISTSKEDSQKVKVGIRDCGTGINENHFHDLLKPFYTTKPSGMGMGLSINRSIIEAHTGRLWARNNPDKGATFYFTLPVYMEE